MISAFANQVEELASRRMRELDDCLQRSPQLTERNALEETLFDECHRMKIVAAQLASRLNLLRAPILRLPPELLRAIIAPLATDQELEREQTGRLSWIYLGHICSEIRRTLLAMPETWAKAVFTPYRSPDVTDELLRRAAGVPLTIHLVGPLPSHLSELAKLHLNNARSIIINSPSAQDALLPSLFGARIPSLVNLDIVKNQFLNGPGLEMAPSSQPLLAPQLARLRLCNVIMPFVAANLAELYLSAYSPSGTGDGLILIFESLRACANLRILHLCWMVMHLAAASKKTYLRSISLPSLQELNIMDTIDNISWVWSHLSIPSDTSVSIVQTDVRRPDALNLSARIDSLRLFICHVRGPDARPISGFALNDPRLNSNMTYKLYATDVGAAPDPEMPASSPFYRDSRLVLDVRIQDIWPTRLEAVAAISQISDMFGLADVEKVELNCEVFYEQPLYDNDGSAEPRPVVHPASVLQQFPNMRSLCLTGKVGSLCLTGYAYYGVYAAIVATPPEGSEDSVICPKLRSLALIELPFAKNEELTNFISVIERRASMGAPLQELKIGFPNSREKGMNDEEASRAFRTRLQALVPSVEFLLPIRGRMHQQ